MATKSTMKIIGLMGYAGSGKDTTADMLGNKIRVKSFAFADKLREIAGALNLGLPVESEPGTGSGLSARYLDLIELAGGYNEAKLRYSSVRPMLVSIGEGMRKVFGENFWIEQAMREIDKVPADTADYAIITDVRYPNDCAAILERGGVIIYVNRSGVGPANATESASISESMKYVTVSLDNDAGTRELDGKCALLVQVLPHMFAC